MFSRRTNEAKEEPVSVPLVLGVVGAILFGGAALLSQQKRKRARGEVKKRPRPPALAYDVSSDDLRPGDVVLEYRVGQQARISATPNPSAGIRWSVVLTEVGPEGAPVTIRAEDEGALQRFYLTAARIGSANAMLTAKDPQGRVVDAIPFFIETE